MFAALKNQSELPKQTSVVEVLVGRLGPRMFLTVNGVEFYCVLLAPISSVI